MFFLRHNDVFDERALVPLFENAFTWSRRFVRFARVLHHQTCCQCGEQSHLSLFCRVSSERYSFEPVPKVFGNKNRAILQTSTEWKINININSIKNPSLCNAIRLKLRVSPLTRPIYLQERRYSECITRFYSGVGPDATLDCRYIRVRHVRFWWNSNKLKQCSELCIMGRSKCQTALQ